MRRAIELDPDDADRQAVASSVPAWRGDWGQCTGEAEPAGHMRAPPRALLSPGNLYNPSVFGGPTSMPANFVVSGMLPIIGIP
jgi:hypothetical protein